MLTIYHPLPELSPSAALEIIKTSWYKIYCTIYNKSIWSQADRDENSFKLVSLFCCLLVCLVSVSQSFSFSLPTNVAFCFASSHKALHKPRGPLIEGHGKTHSNATGSRTMLQLISWWLVVHFCGYHGDVKLWPAEDFLVVWAVQLYTYAVPNS